MPDTDRGLQDLKSYLTWAKSNKQSTDRATASAALGNAFMFADHAINSHQIEFLWGAQLSDEADAAGRIIAYQRTAPSDGGWVLFQDGSLREISAEAFAAAEKAEP